MPTIDLDPEKVTALFQNGHISPEVYNKIMGPDAAFPAQQPPLAPPPPDEGLMLAGNGSSMPQDGLLAQNQGGVDPEIEKRRALAQKAGISDDVINQRLGPAQTPEVLSSDIKKATPKLNLASDAGAAPAASASGAQSPYDPGFNQQIQGVNDAAKATGQKSDAQNKDINDYLKKMDSLESDRQTNEIFRKGQMDLAVKDLDDSTNAVASMKVDPKQFWAKADTGDKILMGVSLFLGAFGAANDGVNRVVPIITGAIDRDIAAQKANIASAREGVNQKANALSQLRSVFKDDRMAEEAARIAALEKVKMQVMQKSMQYSSPEVKANAKKLIGELEVKKAEARAKFLDAAKNGGIGLTPSEKLSRKKYDDERQTPLGMVSDPREAPKVRDMKSVVDPLRSNLNDLEAITKEGRAWMPLSERSRRAEVLATDTQLQMKELNRLGVLSQGDLELMQKMIPSDPTAIFQTNAHGRIQEAQKLVQRKWKAFIEARGLHDPSLEDKPRGK